MPDDLRTLIERVEKAGGPLRFRVMQDLDARPSIDTADGHSAHQWQLSEPRVQDILAGVLRRDMASNGVQYQMRGHAADPSNVIITWQGRWPESRAVRPATSPSGSARGGLLVAWIECWLAARVAGLVGRQEATNGE